MSSFRADYRTAPHYCTIKYAVLDAQTCSVARFWSSTEASTEAFTRAPPTGAPCHARATGQRDVGVRAAAQESVLRTAASRTRPPASFQPGLGTPVSILHQAVLMGSRRCLTAVPLSPPFLADLRIVFSANNWERRKLKIHPESALA
jgi:hypothetical protein